MSEKNIRIAVSGEFRRAVRDVEVATGMTLREIVIRSLRWALEVNSESRAALLGQIPITAEVARKLADELMRVGRAGPAAGGSAPPQANVPFDDRAFDHPTGHHAPESRGSEEVTTSAKVTQRDSDDNEPPLFDIALAAGPWTDIESVGEAVSLDQAMRGTFCVRLAGDSMEPNYHAGDIVTFRKVPVDPNSLRLGRDYYVHRLDGTATFKRLRNVTEREITLAPLSTKYPRFYTVPLHEVVNMAIAIKHAKHSK